MTQRTKKVESLIQQIVAAEVAKLPDSGRLTVTSVEVTPDLRQASVWVGVIAASEEQGDELFASVAEARKEFQGALAANLKIKFTPHIELKRDVSGEYAQNITKLIRGL